MTNNNNFSKVYAFGTPNAMAPNTISNGVNGLLGCEAHFGSAMNNSPNYYYLYNGIYNSPYYGSTEDTQFVVPKSGTLKSIIVNVSTISNTDGIKVYKNGILFYTSPATSLPNNIFYTSFLYVNTGDKLQIQQGYQTGNTTISLYIE